MAAVSLYDRLAPPEPEFSDEEWDRAEQALIEERLEMGWSEQESRVAVDDYLIAEKCERMREDHEWYVADEVRARRKEDW